MEQEPYDYTPQGHITRLNARVRELEDKLQFWQWTAIGMTVVAIVLAAMKCQN